MRLGRSASGEERRKDKTVSRKKHKRLDAICEQAYSRSHSGVAREKSSELNVGEDNVEVRRSSRVRKAPVLLDTSPPPAKKRRKVEKRSGVSSVDRVKREGRVKRELDCSVSGDLKGGSSGWQSRLRTRAKGVGYRVKEKGIRSPRGKRKLFDVIEEVNEESSSEDGEFDVMTDDVVIDKSIVVKSQRPGRTEGSDVSGSERQDIESLSEAGEFEEVREDVVVDKSIVAKSQRPGRTECSNISGSEPQTSESSLEAGEFDEMKEDVGIDKSIVAKSSRPGRNEGLNVSGSEPQDVESLSDAGEFDEMKADVVIDKSVVAKSQMPGRSEGTDVPVSEHQTVDLECPVEDDKMSSEREVLQVRDEGVSLLQHDIEQRDDKKVNDDDEPLQLVDLGKREDETGKQSENTQGNDRLVTSKEDLQAEEHVFAVGADQLDPVEVDVSATNTDKDARVADIRLKNETFEKSRKKDYTSDGPLEKLRIKEGRHCGLCGTGNDGKPPKKMVQDGAGSDGEAYSGSSASEEPNYDIWDGFGDEPGWLGRLLGPINDRFGIAGIFVHQQCAVWSPEVYFAGLGCLKNVRAALCRGRALKCSRCVRPGATIGCRVDRCPRTYHLPCARANGCIFDHRKFLIACTDHRHLFQPQGTQFFDRLKKLKAKKMKLEMRKTSNDAWRKDVEEEEKWLENCGEDEEFLKRESKRLHRDLLRIAPTYIGGSNCNQDMQFEGWESVAGLQNVIQCMKEVVILPLLYPEFFDNLGITPPRGVLLHGYPGTGKTLVVRALIGSCARGDKRIAYFARKGADCLGKYVGDAERQLRLLFQVAEKSQPSIIFFDEIDGLAPSRTPQQDQTHSSVVSTLLALMDGLKSRGSVVVIGATNRPDAVDPALRRPGRFDREIYFPLPSLKDREAILLLHTQKWPKPITGSLLQCIARKTVGYAGADLQALCTQAAVIALRRRFPLQELLSAAAEKTTGPRPPLPTVTVEERDWLEALSIAPPPCSQREAGMAANDLVSSPLQNYLVPCLLQPISRLLISLYLDERVWLPPHLFKAATLVENVILSALDEKKLKRDKWWSHAYDLLEQTNIKCEIEDRLRSAGIVIGDTCFDSTCTIEDDTNDNHLKLRSSRVLCTRPGLLQNRSHASRAKSGFRILISGNPRSGQRHLASCLLHYFVGNVEVQKVDLATISQEGHGDMVQGLTQLLMRCASLPSCMMFMPRIDLWAIDILDQEYDLKSCSCRTQSDRHSADCSKHVKIDEEHKLCATTESEDTAQPQSIVTKASYLWNTFIEQVDSVCVNTSLMILATSEVQFSELPSRIRQFFRAEILRGNISTPVGDSVPQFVVEVDGKFDCDVVLDSCAVKLTKDLAQHFVQIVYYRSHSHVNSFKDVQLYDGVQETGVAACLQSDIASVMPPEGKGKLCPIIPVSSTALGNVSVKGKSSLQLAISAFGYQILLYPHFAELCWVTSKLKEGPSANINGPWKGWPFNSCIARPFNSVEKVAAVSGGGFIKIKEKSSIVRGLIAVGLSAYRAEYRSLRAVVSEVRKVLELLVERINSKIQAGKDRYCYVRVMSQVAYLEDVVLSWAHALQRLEVDTRPDSELPCKASLDYGSACKNGPLEGNESKKDTSNQILQACEVLEKSPDNQTANTIGGIGQKEDGDIGQQNTFSEITVEEEKTQLVVPDSTAPPTHPQISMSIGVDFQHVTDATGNGHGAAKDSVPNGSLETKSVTDGAPCDSGDQSSTQFRICQLEDVSFADNNGSSELVMEDTSRDNVDGNHSSGSMRGSPRSSIMCSYRCCSDCVVKLHQLVKEILVCYRDLKGNLSAVEEVHDIVSCLSSKLHTAVRRLSMTENTGHSCEKNPMEVNDTKPCQEMGVSPRNDSGRPPIECHCHTSSSVNQETKENCSQLDLKFILRDGVLTTLHTNDDLSIHCNFKILCLCSLIEILVMSKEHFE